MFLGGGIYMNDPVRLSIFLVCMTSPMQMKHYGR